jgi:predicted double-glycine peptidase
MKRKLMIFLPVLSMLLLSGCAKTAGPRISIGGTGLALVIATPVKSDQEIKWENVKRQSLDISCGPAALSTLINYYLEDQVSEMDIISSILQSSDMTKVKKIQKRQAFSLLDLKKFAKSRGYQAAGYNVGVQDLLDFKKPVIIPIETMGYRHFVVFKGIQGDRVYLADPAFGNRTMRYPQFLYVWKQRVALVISDRDGKEIKNHDLSLNGKDGVYVDGTMHRVLNPGSINFISMGDF